MKFDFYDLMRNDFMAFLEQTFLELNPREELHDAGHLRLIAAKLEEVEAGRTKRLIINVPPRSLKSISASVAYPAWLLGRNQMFLEVLRERRWPFPSVRKVMGTPLRRSRQTPKRLTKQPQFSRRAAGSRRDFKLSTT